MTAGRGDGSQLLFFTLAIDPLAEKIALRGVFWRGVEIKPAICCVHFFHTDDIEVARRNAFHVAAVARDRINVSPAVTFARPKKSLAVIYPLDIAASQARLVPVDVAPRDVHPGVVFFGKHRMNFASLAITKHDHVRVLQAVELLNDNFIGVCGPLHAGQIVVAWVAGNIEPACGAPGGAYHTNACGRISLTCFWIRKRSDLWIESSCVVDELHLFHAFGIKLPVGDLFAVRTPAPAVAAKEFLFIDPVESAIDNVARAILC